jgi:3-deoxy-manno-octulosonate cytidylyltransferase (CMP-KDO synthetase)
MRVIGVIPARFGSTRLPGKSLLPICGKPLVQRVFERAQMATQLDDLIVATDDARIMAAVSGFGGKAVMTRLDHVSGTDRVAEAVAGSAAELVVNIQGDEPLLDPALIDSLVVRMRAEVDSWDMGTAAAPLMDSAALSDSSVVKVVRGARQQALYFSRSVIPYSRDGDARMLYGGSPLYWRHIGLYAYRYAYLRQLVAEPPCLMEQVEKLEQLRALYMGCRMVVVEAEKPSIGVDTPADLEHVERIIREQESHG